MIGSRITASAVLAGALLLSASAWGQQAAQQSQQSLVDDTAVSLKMASTPADKWDDNRDEWHYRSYTALWAAGVEGTFGGEVRGEARELDVDKDFSDLMENFKIGISPWFEIGKGPFTILIDATWQRWENDVTDRQNRDYDITADWVTISVGGAYRVLDVPLAGGGAYPTLGIDAMAGLRWSYMSFEIEPADQDSESRDQNWFDPWVGARAEVQFSQAINAMVWGSIGGFSVDDDDLMWSAGVMGEYRFSPKFSIIGGYKALSYDVEKDDFVWDVTFSGPFLGVSFRH